MKVLENGTTPRDIQALRQNQYPAKGAARKYACETHREGEEGRQVSRSGWGLLQLLSALSSTRILKSEILVPNTFPRVTVARGNWSQKSVESKFRTLMWKILILLFSFSLKLDLRQFFFFSTLNPALFPRLIVGSANFYLYFYDG